MTTPEAEAKLADQTCEQKESLTSVTHEEKFSVPDGHEVSIDINGEVLVNEAPVAFNDTDGKVISITSNAAESADTGANNVDGDEGVENNNSNSNMAEESDLSKCVNGPEESDQHNNTNAARAPTECMLDCTSTLITEAETVSIERATLDAPVLLNQPEIGPTVFRPRRPPPPKEVHPQINVVVQPTVHASPPGPGQDGTLTKSRSLSRGRPFGTSMRNAFTSLKNSMLRKKNKTGTVGTHPSRGHCGVSNADMDDRRSRGNRMKVTAGHDTQSLNSSTWASHNSSANNTPQLGRKHQALQEALPDLLTAMEPSSSDVSTKVHVDSVQGTPQDHADGKDVYAGRPVGFQAGASMNRRRTGTMQSSGTVEIRRTQTMRTPDYAGRLRDRMRSYRPESIDNSSPGDTSRRKTRNDTVYVRSDHISWPPKFFKSKRQSGKPPQTVYSHGQEPGSRQTLPTSPQHEAEVKARLTGQVQIEPPVMVHSAAPNRVSLHLSKEDSDDAPGLTSLRSEERFTLLQLTTKESPNQVKPVSNQTTSLPYFSNNLSGKAESLNADVHMALQNCVNEVHPFLVTLDCRPQSTEEKAAAAAAAAVDSEEQQEESRKTAITCLQNYLATCIKLRSVDLQGQFAPFHYPLKGFNTKLWDQCAVLEDHREINILREPKWNTEYVELASIMKSSIPEQKIFHADRPVDTLLTTWLDCHETAKASAASSVGPDGKYVYHPVQVAARLDQVLGLDEHMTLLDHCLRLAVLLTYNYVKQYYIHLNQDIRLDTEAKNILLLMSTSDCLVIFTHMEDNKESGVSEEKVGSPKVSTEEAKDKPADESDDKQTVPETDDTPHEEQQVDGNQLDPEQRSLLQGTKCDSYTSDEKAIDGVIAEIRQCAEGQLSANLLAAPLMKAIAPPDWIAMTLARVCIGKQ